MLNKCIGARYNILARVVGLWLQEYALYVIDHNAGESIVG
jgi:hypothetical protein